MTASTDSGGGRPSSPPSLDADDARIRAEISGTDTGTDPFVAAVRATRMPMIITNPRLPDNPVVFTNDAFCRLTGYERSEIIGRNCRFLQGPDADPATVRTLRDAVVERRSVQVDIRNRRKNGEPFWNRLLLAPVRNTAGEVAYFFASQVDVTVEREKLLGLETQNAALLAELSDRLRSQEDSEARLRFATRAGGLGIWELDLRTGELDTSDTFRTNFGRDPSEPFSYDELRAAIHPDDRDRIEAAMERSRTAGDDYDVEHRVVRPDGAFGTVQVRAQVERSADGSPRRMAGTSIDTTAATRASERARLLLELDETFSAIDDPAEIAYSAAEALGRTLEVSRAGYGTIDLAAETFTVEKDWNGPGIQSLAGVLDFRDYGSYIDDLKRGETVVFEDATRDPRTVDTADALIGISAQSVINMPVTESKGLAAMLYLNHATARTWTTEELSFVREVAHRTRMAVARRVAETELRDLAATLESQVADRTAELMASEAALRQSQKMEAVGQLTSGLAHDFNNILAAISGSLELMRRRKLDAGSPAYERFLEIAQSATRKAASLTHRLLAFSRQQTLEPKPVNVNRLVAGMEDLIRRTTGPGVTLEVVAAMGLWGVHVDPGQLENVLLNLCINARDAMPDGGRLTIETANRWIDARGARERDIEPGQYVSMCVSDDGTGMSPDVVARAFDPFFTTKPIGQGTGLGLSMVYGFAKQSGGQVRIYSELDHGTMVCIYLPRKDGAEQAAEATAAPSAVPEAQRGETVLVVDDEAMVRALMVEALVEAGYRVVEAADGLEAASILRSDERVDLLVTDVGLPGGMNGRQVADTARIARPGLRVLFITGYAENAVLSHGHLDPGMHVMTKPFDLEVLTQRVKSLIEER